MYRFRKELASSFYILSIHLGVVDMLTITLRNATWILMPVAFIKPNAPISPEVYLHRYRTDTI